MTKRDDLVSRLYQHHEAMLGPDYFQAASALEAKDAEIARLREIMDDAADLIKKQQEWQTYGEQLERNSDAAMAAEIQEQRKKNDALRDRISDLERQLADETERCVGYLVKLRETHLAKAKRTTSPSTKAAFDKAVFLGQLAAAIRGGAK